MMGVWASEYDVHELAGYLLADSAGEVAAEGFGVRSGVGGGTQAAGARLPQRCSWHPPPEPSHLMRKGATSVRLQSQAIAKIAGDIPVCHS